MRRGRGCSVKVLRAAAIYFLNLLLATIVTDIVMHPFKHYEAQSDPYYVVWQEYMLSALAAFGVGFSVYWTWRKKASKWVWVAGLCWFAWRAVSLYVEQRGMLFGKPYDILNQISGSTCSYTSEQSVVTIDAVESVPLVRTVIRGARCPAHRPFRNFISIGSRVFPDDSFRLGRMFSPI